VAPGKGSPREKIPFSLPHKEVHSLPIQISEFMVKPKTIR